MTNNPVEIAHPFVQTNETWPHGPAVQYRDRRPDESEDLDALPVEEQAAIACAIQASGPHAWAHVDVAGRAIDAAIQAYRRIPDREYARHDYPHTWALAEARLRNGEGAR